MTINYNVTGTERKALVTTMGEILEVKPKYLGMPTAAYEVDYFTIDKNGKVEFSDRADSEEVEKLLEQLAERGFTAELVEALEETKETDGTEENASQEDAIGFTITVPLDKVAVGTLTSLLDAKGSLIKKALGIDGLPIEINEDTVSFPWFVELPTPDECTAYTHLIGALCKMSQTLKRVTATERPVENEKYTFRCFLLRLGFIGDEYKQDRKILLRNLEGNSAWRLEVASMRFPSREIVVDAVRNSYPAGTRVELVQMRDVQAPPIGTQGTVIGVDDTASVMVAWDNGSGLNVIYGEDIIRKVSDHD